MSSQKSSSPIASLIPAATEQSPLLLADDGQEQQLQSTTTKSASEIRLPGQNERPGSTSMRSSINSMNSSFREAFTGSVRRSLSYLFMDRLSSRGRNFAIETMVGVGEAAHLIRDAVVGETTFHNDKNWNRLEGMTDASTTYYDVWYDPYVDRNSIRNLLCLISHRLLAYRWMRRLMLLNLWILVALTFIEPPSWCRHETMEGDPNLDYGNGACIDVFTKRGPPAMDFDTATTSMTENDEQQAHVEYYPNSHSMWLTLQQSYGVECFCLGVACWFILLALGRDGFEFSRFCHKGRDEYMNSFRCVLVAVLMVSLGMENTIYSPYFRALLLGSYLKKFQKELASLLRMLPQVCYILALLGVLILFYGWFGVVLFFGSEQGKRDFSNLIEGCWTLWICVTTANYPDVMMPSYNDHRLSAIFFISFMILSFFFLMNLVLASVVNAYDETIDLRKKERKRISKDNLTRAFQLMDPKRTGVIPRETIMGLFQVLNEDFPEIHKLTDEETKLLFGFLDKDGSSTITLDEFQNFGKILLLEFTKESYYATFVQVNFPEVFNMAWYQRLQRLVQSTHFEYFVDVLLALNAIVIGIQSYPQLTGEDVSIDPHFSDGYIDTVWELMESMFTVVYVVEVMLKVMVNGWRKYRESPRNMFDFLITLSALVATGYVYYPNAYSDTHLIRFIVMARVLRLGRLLVSIRAFQVIGIITAEILPAAVNFMLLLFFLMYFFAVLGVILYGGMITRDPSNPLASAILNTDFADNDYWGNNFNDMMSGMNVLFNLLVVNNWTNCEIGFEAVTGGKFVRFYFLTFHLLGVILVNNLVMAFIINAFFQQLATLDSGGEEDRVEGEAIIRGKRATFDASEITGTTTGTSGAYIARLRALHADIELDEREGLHRLFTQTNVAS